MSLLGSMLLDREAVGLVLPIIPRDESRRFNRSDHQALFEVLIDLYDGNRPIDLIVLEDELRRRDKLDLVGGREYLITLSESVPSAANAEYYARIVRDKGMLRDVIACAGEIMDAAYAQGEPAQQIMDEAEKKLFGVTEQRISNNAISIREFLDETWKQIETQEEGALSGIATGYLELDHMLGGLQYGDLVILAARPSMGKTAIGLSMLANIGIGEGGERGTPCAFFSLEMSNLQVAQRMLCSRGEVEMYRLRQGRLSEREITHLQLVMGHMRDCPIYVDDTPGMSVMELRAKARRLKMRHDIQVIFVDYLQLMFDKASKESRQQEISAISRGLKALARELRIPVVALAQLNRQVEGRTGNRPRMSDLRESGAIEQDADVVMLLHREEYYVQDKGAIPPEIKGKAELIVEKQRNGPTGVVELVFQNQFMRFLPAAAVHLRDESEYSGGSAQYDPAYDAPRESPRREPPPSSFAPPPPRQQDVVFDPEGPGPPDADEDAPF